MKSLIVLSALLLSSLSFAADCGRVEGTPGFQGRGPTQELAKVNAKGQCEGYQEHFGVAGTCSDMGCQNDIGGYICVSLLTICR